MKESYLNYHYTEFTQKPVWLFVTPSLESGGLQTVVQELGHFKFRGTHFTERGPLQSYQLGYSYKDTGGFVYLPDGSKHAYLGKNEFLFLDCTKGYRIETDCPGDILFAHFWNPNIRYYFDLFYRLNNGALCAKPDDPFVEDNLIALIELYKKPNDLRTDIYAEMLIMNIVTAAIRSVTPLSGSTYSSYVQRAIEIIEAGLDKKFSLDDLAGEVHVSKYYLSHIFKQETGSSPINYLQKLRINKAKELLRTTNYGQEAICAKIGLYNCSHLCRLFRLYENTTPDQYRRKWR